MKDLIAECEMALSLLIHLSEADAAPSWKRVLCMEIFRSLHNEPALVRLTFSLFDNDEGHKDIIKDHMASLVRLASENPSLIGVSHQSTVPHAVPRLRSITDDQITLEAGVAGVIGTSVSTAEDNVTGISSEWSTVRVAYLELLDKLDAPVPPDTYVYTLVLTCISSLSEGLAKFILPLTVPDAKGKRKHRILTADFHSASSTASPGESRKMDSWKTVPEAKRQVVPLDPMSLQDHPQIAEIKICADIIDTCWPAILATCSTFLHAALDADFYHNLVRSFQKLTHVAGLIRQSTARDAFLTTLGKTSIPSDGMSIGPSLSHTTGALSPNSTNMEPSPIVEMFTLTSGTSTDVSKSLSETKSASLSTRNLLCLRALLNLGIALGPTLDQAAWGIILETLQSADLVINASASITLKHGANLNTNDQSATRQLENSRTNVGSEIVAVQAAVTKLFEGTTDYPYDSFQAILQALLQLSDSLDMAGVRNDSDALPLSPSVQSPRRLGRVHQNTRSLTLGRSRILDDELQFALEKINELSRYNFERLSVVNDDENGPWQLLTKSLISVIASSDIKPQHRLRASKVLDTIIFWSMGENSPNDEFGRERTQIRNLMTLMSKITILYERRAEDPGCLSATDMEIHEHAIDILKSILERYGDSFTQGWDVVFEIISSVFEKQHLSAGDKTRAQMKGSLERRSAKSSRLVRSAFSSMQLITSDFLALLPITCLLDLVRSLSNFAAQNQDFNISLTTTTLFWNVSDFLQTRSGHISLENILESSSEKMLCERANEADPLISNSSIWLILLLEIVELTTDDRPEVRNSAIQTLLRILDSYSQQLSPKAWHLCLNRVLFTMFEDNRSRLLHDKTLQSDVDDSEDFKAWIATSIVMIKACCDLIATLLNVLVQVPNFDSSWERLLSFLDKFIEVDRNELTEAVYVGLAGMLSHVDGDRILSQGAILSTWSLWVHRKPSSMNASSDSPESQSSNKEASIAYLHAFQQIYRLYKSKLNETDIDKILQYLQAAIWHSTSSRYSVDIDHLTTLQELVVNCLHSMCMDLEDAQAAIIICLAEFSDSALSRWRDSQEGGRPTFVAFSKKIMELLSWYIADKGIKRDVFSNSALTIALEHLSNPIVVKYQWCGKDHQPLLWQKATTASLKVLGVAIPYIESQYNDHRQLQIARFWRAVVTIARGIISANIPAETPVSLILSDEAFDVNAFKSLISIIIPSLGSPVIPDRVRREFSCAVFESSIIHPFDSSDPSAHSISDEPLQNLYKIRRGRTYELSPTPRCQMAYVLVDEIFDLATSVDLKSSLEAFNNGYVLRPNRDVNKASVQPTGVRSYGISLARSILPYLILRASMPIKSYVADQPLRGLMPQPTSARKELLHILARMIELRSEPTAIPDAATFPTGNMNCKPVSGGAVVDSRSPSQTNDSSNNSNNNPFRYRKHLGWVYPLIVKAAQVAGKEQEDGKVLEALVRVLDEVGNCSSIWDTDTEGDNDEEDD